MIIVIDGPSGSGKGTLAKRLADDFNWAHFDTGAMYRSVCWYLLEHQIDLDDENAIKNSLDQIHYEIKREGSCERYFVNGHEVTKAIRTRLITKHVSKVSAYPKVREFLVPIQRKYAQDQDAIFEGRDMGTVVFPDAKIKFYLEAKALVRALRRCKQLKELYPNKSFDVEEIHQDILRRDQYDSTRTHSPLKKADDAIAIDTSELSIDQVFENMKSYIEEINS